MRVMRMFGAGPTQNIPCLMDFVFFSLSYSLLFGSIRSNLPIEKKHNDFCNATCFQVGSSLVLCLRATDFTVHAGALGEATV